MRGKGKSVPAVLLQGPEPLTMVMVSLMALPGPWLTGYILNCPHSYSHQALEESPHHNA